MSKLYLFFLLVFNLSCTVFFYLTKTYDSIWNFAYNLTFASSYALAAFFLLKNIALFPKFRSVLALLMFGYLSTFLSMCIWFFYNTILKEEIPFPSIADFFWILFYPAMAVGLTLLLKKIKNPLTWVNGIELVVLSSILFTIITTFLNTNRGITPTFNWADIFNTLYTVFDSFLIALSVITLRSHTNVKNQSLLFLTFGLIALSIGDTVFAYQTARDLYWNGNISDAIYALSGFLFGLSSLTIGETLTSRRLKKIRETFVEER